MNDERKEKFTPGPWNAYPSSGGCYAVSGQCKVVARCPQKDMGIHEHISNATLIVAAPEMYEWLDHIVKHGLVGQPDRKGIINTLKKARGEA